MSVLRAYRLQMMFAGGVLALLWAIGLVVSGNWIMDWLTSLFAAGLLGMSLHLLIGYTGLVSFGHAAFFAMGGYAFGMALQAEVFTASLGAWSVPAALFIAVIGTGLYALLIGLICARLSEIYFAFLTLAFQMLFVSLLQGFVQYTGGDQGLTGGIPRPVFLGIDLADPLHRYLFCATLFVACILFLRLIVDSGFGYTLRLIRDNSTRAEFLGIAVVRAKIAAFVIAGSVAAVGGVILALFTSGAYPEWASWTQSGEAIFMIMLGGLHSFFGPLVGAVLLRVIGDVAIQHFDHTDMFKGVLILLVVLVLRKGVLDFALERFARRKGKNKPEKNDAET